MQIHPQLQQDCHLLGQMQACTLLLHKNALLPWFILLPTTEQQELYQLDATLQLQVHGEINRMAAFVNDYFNTDKLNIATIGNIVPQLHIHVIGRFHNDFCWPAPVWGQTERADYTAQRLEEIRQALTQQDILQQGTTD
ncbi:MAG TPA: HIT domain-containing protein [Gammaproteobacteria bacterium]